MFTGARYVVIQGSSLVAVDHNGMTGLQLLHQKINHGATHDSAERFPPPKCHPSTRKAIVKCIMDWVNDLSRSSSVLWLNGPAGAGKTALAQTICELCEELHQLAGSFFARTIRGRNNAQLLFATIAYQLAIAIPEVGERINEAVASDPSIMNKSIDLQLQKLVIDPLQDFDLSARPFVIVIDGLDECDGESMQCHIIQLIGSIFQSRTFPICFIVASRPEPWIRNEFDTELFHNLVQLSLKQTTQADVDVRAFLLSGFSDIHDNPKHRLTMAKVPKPWPSENTIDVLVDRASGQFIYPTTVLKFIDDPHFRPVDRLRTVLAISWLTKPTTNPLADLDSLYIQILSTSPNKKRTVDVLGTLLVMTSQGLPLKWSPREELLDVAEKLLGLEPGEGYLALRTIHSLVHVSETDRQQETISLRQYYRSSLNRKDGVKFHHKSFPDFLVDATRSGEFFIDSELVHTRMVFACLRTLRTLSLNPPSRENYVTWGYAILHWCYHCTMSGALKPEILDILKRFNIYGCFLAALNDPWYEECLITIKRIVFPADTPVEKLLRRLLWKAREADKDISPNRADIENARDFLDRIGAQNDMVGRVFGHLLNWMVAWLKEQSHPPLKLIAQYQIIANILTDSRRSPIRKSRVSDRYFKRNVPHTLIARWRGFSHVDDQLISSGRMELFW